MPVSALSPAETARLYGPWAGRAPDDAARLMQGYSGPWWVAGGWAIDAFTGRPRVHGDLDLEVLRVDLPRLRKHLASRLDLWTATDGALEPLLPDDTVEAAPDAVLPAGCEQLWSRPNGAEPWEYDILLMTGDHRRWEFKRDRRIGLPLGEVGWTAGGIPYLRPEVQLLLKARALRPKDQRDFEVTLPLLDPRSRAWLRGSLDLAHPDHAWLVALEAAETA